VSEVNCFALGIPSLEHPVTAKSHCSAVFLVEGDAVYRLCDGFSVLLVYSVALEAILVGPR